MIETKLKGYFIMMQCEKKTQLITDFGNYDVERIEKIMKKFVLNGEHNNELYEMFKEWVEKCGMTVAIANELILYSTVFPLRFYMSLHKN